MYQILLIAKGGNPMCKSILSVLVGVGISVGIFFLVFCLLPVLPAGNDLLFRLVFTLKANVFSLLFILLPAICIAIGCMMGKTPCEESHAESDCKVTAANHKFLHNTVHNLFVFFLSSLILSTFLDPYWLRIIPAITAIFCFGRFTGWMGALCHSKCEGGYWQVMFGRGINFVLNSALIVLVFVLFFVRM